MTLFEKLQHSAKENGFPVSGGVDLEKAWDYFEDHAQFFQQWLDRGYDGSMSYLRNRRDERMDPTKLYPEAKSVFCVMYPYSTKPRGPSSSVEGVRYARYLQGKDYHIVLKQGLKNVLASTQNEFEGFDGKICVDTNAVLERTWAAFSGLGWIGKNTMLIHPKWGSYFFIGVMVLNQTLDQSPELLPDYCGHCERCLKGCPTQAFPKAKTLDATQCISYWTLEKREELNLDPSQKQKIGNWVAGCDICQEVCPFNFKRVKQEANEEDTDQGAIRLNRWESLLTEGNRQYRKRVKHSALNRVKPEQFQRNLAIALQNTLQQLDTDTRERWSKQLKHQVLEKYHSSRSELTKQEWSRVLAFFEVPS